jgi:hypothetical protein
MVGRLHVMVLQVALTVVTNMVDVTWAMLPPGAGLVGGVAPGWQARALGSCMWMACMWLVK